MDRGEVTRAANRNLALATVAFAFCLSAWGMLAPLGTDRLGVPGSEPR